MPKVLISSNMLVYLSIASIECQNSNSLVLCGLYELSNEAATSTALLLKCAYFGLNGDENQSDIHFKQALKNADNDANQLQQSVTSLFDFNCWNIIKIDKQSSNGNYFVIWMLKI